MSPPAPLRQLERWLERGVLRRDSRPRSREMCRSPRCCALLRTAAAEMLRPGGGADTRIAGKGLAGTSDLQPVFILLVLVVAAVLLLHSVAAAVRGVREPLYTGPFSGGLEPQSIRFRGSMSAGIPSR